MGFEPTNKGFANPRWWDKLAADEKHKRAPDEQWFKFYNHPRERVSWYDAIAFCRWLTELARTHSPVLPEVLRSKGKCEITLPTEWQWEKAARGGLPSPVAFLTGEGSGVRAYPYGKDFDAAKGNTDETGIGQTSAVGIFPNGASPYGVLEMSGNVWEWCLNEYGKPSNTGLSGSELRVVRGGAWFNDSDNARAAYRYYYHPDSRNAHNGFRVCVRPPSL